MTHAAYVKEHAIRLRVEKHLSIDEIAERLALAKTTIYYWVNHIPLGRDRQWSVGQKRAHEAVRARVPAPPGRGERARTPEYDELVELPTFRDFVVLYIAEGSKRNRNRVEICNSDDRMVALAVGWLRRLSASTLRFQVQVHAD
jgi:hypothetical protein